MHTCQARPHEREPAFRLLLRHLAEHERDGCVARALELIQQGQLDPEGIFVLREGNTLLGAIVCAAVPGAGAVVWPPAVASPLGAAEEDLLVRSACDWLRQHGACLGQALLSPDELPLARPLQRNGFAQVTSLAYLHRKSDLPGEAAEALGRLRFEPYDPGRPDLFHETLARTYEATLDCPEVNGVRTIAEVIQGHQAQGGFDPRRWWLARRTSPLAGASGLSDASREQGQPVGVLLVAAAPGADVWEVSYVGIVPEARRQGFANEMLQMALREARAVGAQRITLCVDDRNVPAWELYRRLGFELYERRFVFLAVWRRGS